MWHSWLTTLKTLTWHSKFILTQQLRHNNKRSSWFYRIKLIQLHIWNNINERNASLDPTMNKFTTGHTIQKVQFILFSGWCELLNLWTLVHSALQPSGQRLRLQTASASDHDQTGQGHRHASRNCSHWTLTPTHQTSSPLQRWFSEILRTTNTAEQKYNNNSNRFLQNSNILQSPYKPHSNNAKAPVNLKV